MRFIDPKRLAKVNELAKGGDAKAKDFLFNFMDMDDEQANAYLSSLDENPQEENREEVPEWRKVIQALIDDENEAIDGYDKAIKFVSNSDLPELIKAIYLERLNHIKDEEIEHIAELKEIA